MIPGWSAHQAEEGGASYRGASPDDGDPGPEIRQSQDDNRIEGW